MKNLFKLSFLILVLSFISCSKESKPSITKITPEKYLELKSNIKKKTIIHFWFSYCEPCIKDYPELNKIVTEKNIDLINISSDKMNSKMEENLERVMTKLKIQHSYIIDFNNLYPNGNKAPYILGDFAKKINMETYGNPYYIFVNENGKTVIEDYDLNKIIKQIK